MAQRGFHLYAKLMLEQKSSEEEGFPKCKFLKCFLDLMQQSIKILMAALGFNIHEYIIPKPNEIHTRTLYP